MCPSFDASSTHRGRLAEALAAAYLELLGFTILERNHRDGPRELDIIAHMDGWLTVVEVRFRSRSDRGLPEESLHRGKLVHLQRAARSYWLERGRAYGPLRIDLITIQQEEDGIRLRHHPHFLLNLRTGGHRH